MGIRERRRCRQALGAFGMTSSTGMKTLSLVKGKEHFCFRYEVGQESKVLESLIEMVNARELSFDWFDAAVLSHQLGQHLAKELKTYLPKKAA
jgi:transcriptional regulator NrdR family protein